MTEEVVAPLDAYATAKPDEPTFTLQGGDPLAGPLVRAWARCAMKFSTSLMRTAVVAPLDAYATAKPDEPTFTLQGGDPLAGPLVRAWALLARRRCGVSRFQQDSFSELIEAAIGNSVADDEREHDSLLLRATAAEEVSWAMDAYRKGDHPADVPTETADTHLSELARIDLHDVRVRTAQKLSNFRCELMDLAKILTDAGFSDEEVLSRMIDVSAALRVLNERIEPRRILKKD